MLYNIGIRFMWLWEDFRSHHRRYFCGERTDDGTTIMIQLTYADGVIQEDREISAKRLEEVVQTMLEDREVIVEIKE